jgi:hypothetical protein
MLHSSSNQENQTRKKSTGVIKYRVTERKIPHNLRLGDRLRGGDHTEKGKT